MEILNQYVETVSISQGTGFNNVVFVCLGVILVASILLFLSIKLCWMWPEFFDFLLLLMIVIAFSVGLLFFTTNPVSRKVTTYQVTLNDDYSYNQLIEEYDIIEQNGKILTVREKGWDNLEDGNS